jgi:hypothetical protein
LELNAIGLPEANWDNYATAFPSLAEYEATSGGGDDLPKGDKVPDGRYQLQLVSISDPMKNQFPDPRNKNPKPIVFTYWSVVDADDPNDVGRVLRKKLTYSGHPKSAAYPFLELAYGGSIPPDVQPSFSKMRDMQIEVVLITRRGHKDGSTYEFQAWEAMRGVEDNRRKPVIPF